MIVFTLYQKISKTRFIFPKINRYEGDIRHGKMDGIELPMENIIALM